MTLNSIKVQENSVEIVDKDALVDSEIDKIVWLAVFGTDEEKLHSRWLIWEISQNLGIFSASIYEFYMARAKEAIPLNFTVPAINLRCLPYDSAISVFEAAKQHNVGAVTFELARSEMGYTDQSPSEYASVVLAAAVKAGWQGPVFIQGDHFQAKASAPGVPKEGEIETLKALINESINAGFYNIDIDTSTLVNLEQNTIEDQQKANINYTMALAKVVRDLEPEGLTISIGGEIGHIGDRNSTLMDFEAYIHGFDTGFPSVLRGLSKISVQTGTSHGGVVLPDGTLEEVTIDFNVLEIISRACRKQKIAGAVQHGASTLEDKYFKRFPETGAVEIHLATGFQNMILDHPLFPKDLTGDMYKWLKKTKSDEKKKGSTKEQFYYKTRKKALGEFKKNIWGIDDDIKQEIVSDLQKRFEFLFTELNAVNTREMVTKFTEPISIKKTQSDFTLETVTKEVISGLSN